MQFNRSIVTGVLMILLAALTSACGESKTEEQRMSDAVASFESGKYREALIELKNLLQANPKSKEARILLARASLEVGDADSAEKELERAARLGASDAEIYTLQQKTWLRLAKFQELVDNYSVDKASDDQERADMQLTYAKALKGMNKPVDAKREFESLSNSSAGAKWQSEGLVGLALMARAAGDDETANGFALKALGVYSDSASAYITLGQIDLARGEFRAAYNNFVAGGKTATVQNDQNFVLIAGELESAIGIENLEASKDAANRLFELAPEHPITNYLMARVAYISGDKEMAHERSQKVLSMYPEFIPAQFLQGLLNIERKEYPQAEMFLSNVVAAQPGNYSARKMLAEANLRLGNPSEAANILREGITLGAGVDELSRMLGVVNLQLENSGDSVDILEKALASNPNDEQSKLALIAAYIAAGQADKAQALIGSSKDTEALTPERKAIVKLLAEIQGGDREAAVAQANNILATWPNNARTTNMIGGWFASIGMMTKARTTLDAGFAKNPDNAELVSTLARLDKNEGKSDQAQQRLEQFVERNPTETDIWILLATLHAANNQLEKSKAVLKQAQLAVPESYAPQVYLTRLLLGQRKISEAIKIAEKLAVDHERVAVAQFTYGQVLSNTRQYELALEYLKKADGLKGGQPVTLLYKAQAEARMKRFAQAKKTYQQLWEVDPGNLEAARSLAVLELRQGDNEAAAAMVAAVRKLRPDDVRVDILDADLKAERGYSKDAFNLYQEIYRKRPSRDLALKLSKLAPTQGKEPEVYIRRWLEQTPGDVGARMVLAQSLQQGGRGSDAIAEYEAIIASVPDEAMVLNNLAWLYFEDSSQGSRNRALELSKRAYEQSKDNPQVADTYGWILFRTGQVQEGKEVLAAADARARELNLTDARDITYHYAAALSESGDRAGARLRLKAILNDNKPFYSREDAQQLFDSLAR